MNMGFWDLIAVSSLFPGFKTFLSKPCQNTPPMCCSQDNTRGVIKEGRIVIYIPSTNIRWYRTSWSRSSFLEVVSDQNTQWGAQVWAPIPRVAFVVYPNHMWSLYVLGYAHMTIRPLTGSHLELEGGNIIWISYLALRLMFLPENHFHYRSPRTSTSTLQHGPWCAVFLVGHKTI